MTAKKALLPFSKAAIHSGFSKPTQKNVSPLHKGSERRKYHIGVADLDVFAGYLPDVFEAINAVQGTFEFRKVIVPIRAGLSMSGERTRQIVKSLGQQISREVSANNVYAPDLYAATVPVLKGLAFDAVGLLVSRMIMDEDAPDRLAWNLCWTSRSRTFIVSAYDVAIYAIKAKRPLESCVASLAVAAAFSTIFPKVVSHDETRGCIYDYCEDRDDMVVNFRKMIICGESLHLFPLWVQPDVERVVRAIKDYRGKSRRPRRASKRTTARGRIG